VHHFTCSVGLAQRQATHTAQKHILETEADVQDFIAMMNEKVAGGNPNDILNMDQTPLCATTIHVWASMMDTKHVTLAATVTAGGNMLRPFLIFKGKQNGRITMHKFSTYAIAGKYACQDKAWMDEVAMHWWIDDILKPWKDEQDIASQSMEPSILSLDAYRVHQMGSVMNRIQGMGIEVVHIPAGCTYLCQPVDVGINKPVKS
jgi:hypothetical protein